MSDPTLLAFEIAEAKKARGSQKFNLNPSSLEQARKGLFGSTFFDIETAGLDPKGQVYESGFLSTSSAGEETYRQSFYKSDTDKFSGFTKRTVKSRAVPEGTDLNKIISSSSVGQEGFADHFKTIAPGTDVWVHNLNFESRFLGERIKKDDFVGWAQSNRLESYSDYSPRLFETNMGVKKAVGAAEGLSYTSRGTLDEYLKAQEGVFSAYRSAFIDTPKQAGVTRVADSMTLARSVFGLAQSRGAMAKTGEVFAGTSIESMADAAFGLSERHTALGDAALQKGMVEFLFATGMDLQDGRELTEQQQGFFKKIGLNQQRVKQESAVKTIVDAFNNQQRYAVEKDPELLKGLRTDVGSRSSKLTVSSFDPETGAYNKEIVPTFRRAPFDADNTTLDIDQFVEGRKKASTSRYGLTPDWDKALEDAKRGYIDPFNEAVLRPKRDLGAQLTPEMEGPRISASNALSQSYTPEEIIKRTLTEFEPRADAIKRLAPPDLSIFQQGKKFLGDNWKVAAGMGLGLVLLSQFSGKDDEYNYLEGLKHQGFAGETRRYNTDFGSGIQNFFRAASQRSGKVRSFAPRSSDVLAFAEGRRAPSPKGLEISRTLKARPAGKDDLLAKLRYAEKSWERKFRQPNQSASALRQFIEKTGVTGGWSPARMFGGGGNHLSEGAKPVLAQLGLIGKTTKTDEMFPSVYRINEYKKGDYSKSSLGVSFGLGDRTERTVAEVVASEYKKATGPLTNRAAARRRSYDNYGAKVVDEAKLVTKSSYRGLTDSLLKARNEEVSKAVAESKFLISDLTKGQDGWRVHSTKKSGIEGIIATGRILPGNTNAAHAYRDVGVYASALSGSSQDLSGVAAKTYGDHSILIPPTENANSLFKTNTHEITTNEGLRVANLRVVGKHIEGSPRYRISEDSLFENLGKLDPDFAEIEKLSSKMTSSKWFSSSKDVRSAREVLKKKSWKPNKELFNEQFELAWGKREKAGWWDERTYYAVDDVERVAYNPDHRARPTKIISEEGGSSLAFGHAEQLGLSHPEAAGAMDGVFNVAKEIEALGGQLHIKGGVAREKLVSMIRPEWARKSKDIDLLVTGDVPTDKVYAAMEKHQAFFDVQTTSTLDHFFPTTDSSLNQAVIRVGGDRSEQLIATKGAIEDAFLGRQRYLDFADSSRAKQRIGKLEGNYPGLTTTKGEIPEMNQPYAVISGNDDVYNTIEGLRHQGFAGANRKKNTDFGSGYRGIIGIFGEGGNALTKQTGAAGFLETQVGAARPMLESIDTAFPGTKLLKEYGDAHSKGIDHPVFITSGASRKERIRIAEESIGYYKRIGIPTAGKHDLKAAQDTHYTTLRGVIKHERFHQKVRGSKALQDEIARTEVPEGFRKVFDETYGAQGIGKEQKNIMQEEFLAHKHQYSHYPKSIDESPFKDFFHKYDAQGNMPDAPFKRRKAAPDSDSTRQQSNKPINSISGFSESGMAKFWRKLKSAFGSPWRGPGFDIENIANFMSKSSIERDPNDGLSKRKNDERPVAQVGIRSYRVEDADTVMLMLKGGGEMNLRLAGIDAPETTHEGYGYNPLQDQPYGSEATGKLEDLMAAQGDMKVLFSPDGSDTYGRTAGLIVAEDGTNINLELVRAGAAAALPYGPSSERLYSTGEFAKAQEQAIQSGEGMWARDEWLAAQRAMSNKQRLTHNTLADPQDIYQNFRAAAVLHRMKNPDASLSEMMAAGGKDDFNIHEGLRHGWANANRRADIGDFGSGYVIDKVVRRPARSFALKTKLMNAHRDARSYVKSMFDNENHIGHHRS